MVWGWPSHWWVACSSFAAGALGRLPLGHGRSRRRGSEPTPLASSNGRAGVAERVGTYTGSSTVGPLPAATVTPAMPLRLSSSTERGGSTSGPDIGSVMGGYRGLELATNAAFEPHGRLERYRRLLSPAQAAVFDQLRDDARALGVVPDYALEVMAPHGPWPDPFEDTCEGCDQ